MSKYSKRKQFNKKKRSKENAIGVAIILFVILVLVLCSSRGESQSNQTVNVPATVESEEVVATAPTPIEAKEETTAPVESPSALEIHFIDVGQGDSALVICDEHAMLIDGGTRKQSSKIYSYLKSHEIEHLDYIIGTHAHEDHVGGLSGALNYATVDMALSSVKEADKEAFRDFVKYLGLQGVQITVPMPGDKFELGSSSFEIFGPLSESSNVNNTSIVLRLSYGDFSILFTGDAEFAEEKEILNAGYPLKSTVLKVGHHGSSSATGYQWLYEINPETAVISCGANNAYGHPTEDTLSKLRDADVNVFRTDLQGDIIISAKKDGTYTVSISKGQDADVFVPAA